jgi:ribosomal protein S12 methylthiotransferase accessory factor
MVICARTTGRDWRQPMSDTPAKRHLMKIGFPGGLAVSAAFHGHEILTDQPQKTGGGDTAPPPFDLFLASIGTCAGFYALRFCQSRNIATEDLGITLEPVRDPETRRIGRIRIELQLPAAFPDRYHSAILRAVDQCAVKRHILEPPEFAVTVAAPEPVAV